MAFAAVVVELRGSPSFDRARARRLAYGASAIVAAITVALIAVFATHSDRLPQLVTGNSWSLLGDIVAYGSIMLLCASAAAILLYIGPRNDLFLWFSLALAAVAFGNIVSAVGGGRYTVGWYTCRLSWAVSSSVLLLYFLGQFVRQHGLLERTTDDLEERTRERDRIWNVSEDLLGVSTFDGYFIAFNPAWSRVLGWSEAEIRRMHVDELRHPADIGHSRAGRARLAAGVPTVRLENRFRHKDGGWRWIAWTLTADQGLIYVAGRHVTAEKEAQAALRKAEADDAYRQKMEALGQLTGGVAHDFNNLLMIVGGFIPRLKERVAGDARAVEAAEAIEIAAQRGASLTRQLMSFSRRQPVNPVAIRVGERVEALRTLLAGTVGPSITLRIEAAPDTWTLKVDTNEFELALLNLVLNARDAVAEDGTMGRIGPQRRAPGRRDAREACRRVRGDRHH
ncbi:MAG: PAS domain-containing protein [Reyranellales bacterium]